MAACLTVGVMILGLFLALPWPVPAAANPAADSGYPVLRLQFPRGEGTGASVSLAGARNEYLNFSLLLEGVAPDSLRLRVEGKPPGPPWSFQFYQVVSAPLQGTGAFAPDALLPLSPGAVPQGTGVQVWITVKIPPDASPSQYPWTIIATDASGSLRLPLHVKVWRFSLPDDLPVTILARVHYEDLAARYPAATADQKDKLLRSFLRQLRDYKINGVYGFSPFPAAKLKPGTRVEDFAEYHRMLQYVLNDLHYRAFHLPSLPGAKDIAKPGSDFPARARLFYPPFAEYVRRHGWQDQALIKLWDEPKPPDYLKVTQAYGVVKPLAPGLKTISAGGTPDVDLAKNVDIWVMYGKGYDPAKVAAARQAGQKIWLYANKLHGVNHPLAAPRLLGWYLYRYDFGGLLFWGINYWPTDPWKVMPGREDLLRRGTFVYPDAQGGTPLPTTRLEAVRRGLQDYQYLDLFTRAHKQGLVKSPAYQAVRDRLDRVTRDLHKLSPKVTTYPELEDIRNQIGELLDAAPQPRP
jgi:hypothetical protein